MKNLRCIACLPALLWSALPCSSAGQTVNNTQAVVTEGLLAANAHGSFKAAAYAPDGTLLLLADEHDGIRVLRGNATGTALLAQAHTGSTGDSGTAIAVDASGNVYVTGTTSSGTLTGTTGTAFPSRADTSTNSFLAKYDSNLQLVFLTFLGSGHTAAASVTATGDAAFVTGTTYSSSFPVTASGIQQSPSSGTLGNGFVERFSTSGALVYATYLTGYGGDTAPAAVVADSTDHAYIVGQTAASGYPTISALQPRILGSTSGFLTELTPAGDGIVFSTFIAGTGLTGAAYDTASSSLLLSGQVALEQFPVATAPAPLAALPYETLLRIPANGQSVSSSIALVPGSSSFVSVAPGGGAWVSGSLTTPLFPGTPQPNSATGDIFLLHVTAAGNIDQTLRFGGGTINNPQYASLSTTPAPPAVSSDGHTVALPATSTTTLDSSLTATQRFDLPLVSSPNPLLPSTLRDAVNACTSGQCTGSAGLLAVVETASSQASLGLALDDTPNLTLSNLGSAAATGIVFTASGYSLAGTDCGSTLDVSGRCTLALAGAGPGSLTVSSANAGTQTFPLTASTVTARPLAISTAELDFGIATASSPVSRSFTITNLTGATQTFTSALDPAARTAYTIAQTASDCANSNGTYSLTANASCHITLTLTPSAIAANNSTVQANWLIAGRDIHLTGYAQAADLSLSANELDFGTQFSGTGVLRTLRYLFLSNNGAAPLAHTPVTLPADSPFTLTDECPTTLEPHTVCRLTLSYNSTTAPSADSTTLDVDGQAVLLTGTTLQAASVTGSTANPNLSVTPATVGFGVPVAVTGVSGSTQSVTITNTGGSAVPLTLAVAGDFALSTTCPALLAAHASCTAVLSFAPSQPGARTGLLSVTGGSGFAPAYVTLTGTATPILPANNGVLDLGQTYTGEPLVQWYKVQQSLVSLTATVSGPAFGVAIVQDTGSGHGTLPTAAFSSTATAACGNCWLGVQFLSGVAGTQSTTLSLSSTTGGNPYVLAVTATALPVQGLLLSPLSQDFGPIAVNSSSTTATFTLANLITTAASAQIQSVTATGDFRVVPNNAGYPGCSGQLASTAACGIGVQFAPTSTGERSGTLTVVTDGGTVTAALTGYGLPDPGIAANPASLVFNNVPGTAATQQSVVLTNTGNTAATLGTPVSSDPAFIAASSCGTLAAGALCTVTVTYTPPQAIASGTLTIPLSRVVNGQTVTTSVLVPLSGTYAASSAGLLITPNVANFGSQATGTLGLTREFTLSNVSGKTLNITLAMPQQFPLANPGACAQLAASSSCVFSVSYLPVTSGEATGTVTATGTPQDGSAPLEALAYMIGYGGGAGTVLLTGSTLIPNAPLDFGQVTSGQTQTNTVTLTNNGLTPITIHRITSEPPFYSTTTCGNTLAANAACTATLTYAPVYEAATGTTPSPFRVDTGELIVESDAAISPLTLALRGSVQPLLSANPASSAVLATYSLSEGALTFSNTVVGNASPAQTLALTNTGTRTLHIASILMPPDFTATSACGTLAAGDSCAISVAFTPTSIATTTLRSGTLEIQSDAADSLEYVSLFGVSSAAPLKLAPTTLDFGTVNVGASSQLSVSVTNTTTAPVTFFSATATGDYTISRGTCPAIGATLAASSNCSLVVTFSPTVAGTRTGTLSLSTDATQLPLTVALTGIGALAHLTVAPSALNFGSIAVGAPANLTLTLTNTGTALVSNIATAITGPDAADFAVTVPCSSTSLAPNQACVLTVTFTPSRMSAESAALRITSSDPASPLLVPLTGSGSQPGSFTLTVNGGPSATATVKSGSPAIYTLLVTPLNGFTGNVALTCMPVNPAQYASCSITPSNVSLINGAQTSMTEINTITSLAAERTAAFAAALLFIPWWRRRTTRRWIARSLTVVLMLCALVGLQACGGGGNNKIRTSPPGQYEWQVTASSTSGPVVSQTVTLYLNIR